MIKNRYKLVRGEFQRAAAPEGGAQQWVRGCALCFLISATPALGLDLPSGQSVELREVLSDQVGAERWLRFRFLAPDIARDTGRISAAEAGPDMDKLCGTLVLDYVAEHALQPDKIAISMSDREVPFGTADPDATQFFELYRLDSGACIWEAF